METAISLLQTFIAVMTGRGGVESVAMWFSILIFVVGSLFIFHDRHERD
jgi:hypothetical protein